MILTLEKSEWKINSKGKKIKPKLKIKQPTSIDREGEDN